MSNPSISDSISSMKSSLSGNSTVHPTSIELEPEEDAMRASLEAAITAAIELFQSVEQATALAPGRQHGAYRARGRAHD